MFMGIYESPRELFRDLVERSFGLYHEVLEAFWILYPHSDMTTRDEEMLWYYFQYIRNRAFEHLVLLGSIGMVIETTIQRHYSVIDMKKRYAKDIFDFSTTMTNEQFISVVKWIERRTVKEHVAVFVWMHIVRNRNGFEGNINQRIAEFLVDDRERDESEYDSDNDV